MTPGADGTVRSDGRDRNDSPDGTDGRATAVRRRRDRWVGAGLALGAVLLLAVVVVLALAWWLSEPAGDGGSTGAGPEPGLADAEVPVSPPDDLRAGETWLGDLVLDAGTLATPDTTLRDVEAVGRDVRSGPDGTVVGDLQVEATVPFEVVARELGEGSTVRAGEAGQAEVERDVQVGGRSFRVVATGTVEVERGLVVLEPTAVEIGGTAFLAEAVAALARELVTVEQEVEGVPEGLQLREVEVREDGFRALLRGQDVLLTTTR